MRLRYAASLSVFVATLGFSGCGAGPAAITTQSGLGLHGIVHGGQQPVVGAHVYLFAASSAGYGSAAIPLLSSNISGTDALGPYVLSDSSGNFSITGDYSCTSGTLVYALATQGNPGLSGDQTNPNLALITALGTCPGSGNFLDSDPFIEINEVTTVASVYALSGFMTDLTHVASASTPQSLLGIANAFGAVNNLADISSGTALTTNASGNITVPQPTINTLANIIASCVNSVGSASSACDTLFSHAVNGTTQPTDTVTAALNIAHSPAVNIATLFGLQNSSAPFEPSLTTVPNDFTLSLNITGGGLNEPGDLAIDASGNVWVSNETNNTMDEISPLGAPLSPATGYTGLVNNPGAPTIDLNDHLWVSSQVYSSSLQTYLYSVSEINSSGTLIGNFTGGGLDGPYGAAADGAGNVFFDGGRISVFNANTGAPESSTGYAGGGFYIAVDAADFIWTDSGSIFASSIDRISSDGTSTTTYPLGTYTGPIAVDNGGNIWIAGTPSSPGNRMLNKLTSSGSPASGSPFSGGTTGGDEGCTYCEPNRIVIDGGGNVWIAIGSVEPPYTVGLAEFSNAGVQISPSTTFTSSYLTYPIGLGVDPSGNVWVSDQGGTLVEFVGAAVPVVTPLSVGLKNHTQGSLP